MTARQELHYVARNTFGQGGLGASLVLGVFGWLPVALLSSRSEFAVMGLAAPLVIMGLLYLALLGNYSFAVVHHLASWREGLPRLLGDDRDTSFQQLIGHGEWGAIAASVVTGFMVLVASFLPLFVLTALLPMDALPAALRLSVQAGGTALAAGIFPLAMLTMLVEKDAVAAVFPWAWFRVARRAPEGYRVLLKRTVLTGALAFVLLPLLMAAGLGVPRVGTLLALVPLHLFLIVQAQWVGIFLGNNGPAYDYGVEAGQGE